MLLLAHSFHFVIHILWRRVTTSIHFPNVISNPGKMTTTLISREKKKGKKNFLPPTKSMQVLFKYSIDTSSVDITPKRGNKATGIREVTGKGSSSNIQEKAIKRPTYAHLDLSLSPESVSWGLKTNGKRPKGRTTKAIAFQKTRSRPNVFAKLPLIVETFVTSSPWKLNIEYFFVGVLSRFRPSYRSVFFEIRIEWKELFEI